ncbi:ABC-type transport auxiliary lipoprotein family protein, partial [Deltaproteobacteria bacterium OttesenSCG-928-M10]|nr:ABC-type transport auxiliary lipoprotein family protein [Deltaproteobacteria bacterium OttesenSCG-928-M10]
MKRNITVLMLTAVCLVSLTACLAKPHPQKNTFTLTAAAPAGPELSPANRRTLLVGTVSVAAGFDNRALVYRIGPNQIEEDFYNEFAAPPARLLADQVSQFLDRASRRL